MAKVLIAEDDLLIGDMLSDAVAEGGYEVCGPARTAPEAVRLAERHQPHLAVIDVRLADNGDGMALAAQLVERLRIGIIYATGNCHVVLERRPVGEACLSKPFRAKDVVPALRVVEQIMRSGVSSLPLPPMLRLIPRR
jgi:DNA-binding response OmpR family regulator